MCWDYSCYTWVGYDIVRDMGNWYCIGTILAIGEELACVPTWRLEGKSEMHAGRLCF